ncbi:hypothetical protein GBA52_027282 [Prunus armeniaca]|nr:hypothetical protein GBA52_027282 [Prunus armeniaca]
MKSPTTSLFYLLLCINLLPNFTASEILFQGFNWESWKTEGGWYNSLRKSVPELASSGITHVWLPPPSQAASDEGKILGELWNPLAFGSEDAHRQELVRWVEGAGGDVTAFDFTTKGILQQAVQGELWRLKDPNGRAPGMIGLLPGKSVTFIDNHDTGLLSMKNPIEISLFEVNIRDP